MENKHFVDNDKKDFIFQIYRSTITMPHEWLMANLEMACEWHAFDTDADVEGYYNKWWCV